MKWLLSYLKGTSSMGICFSKKGVKLEGFVDADLSEDIVTKNSTMRYISIVGGTTVSLNV